jgi:hypothetical protein
LHTFVPQPNRKPVPNVGAKDVHEFGAGGYTGINDGMKSQMGITLDTNPAIIGTFSRPGRKKQPDSSDEMPKTAPL